MKDLDSALIASALLLLSTGAEAQDRVHFEDIEEKPIFSNYACTTYVPPHYTPQYFTVCKIDVDFRKNLGKWQPNEDLSWIHWIENPLKIQRTITIPEANSNYITGIGSGCSSRTQPDFSEFGTPISPVGIIEHAQPNYKDGTGTGTWSYGMHITNCTAKIISDPAP